ncbi:toll/interleukin-1 receptor domain-containing protein [Methylobacterium sp. WL7]|uniref:toll/interleukin-1 receptor domain-containing protein n=1 Tax=Methylobacterium sp. WL7 TaxID=2603900 RepID=UPI00165071E1|nr:toll/interleukin-1 receptor domain-containing protein [Methylobacterium sp. WL7]
MWLQAPKKILLSYRRADTGPSAGRLADRLKRHFGERNVFIDVDNIPFGTDFRTHIKTTIENCDFVLVIIGRSWVGRVGDQTRISDIEDHLRIEVETALRVGAVIIPVLVDRAPMPPAKDLPSSIEALAFLNAAPLDTGRDFNIHALRIIEAIHSTGARSINNGNSSDLWLKKARLAVLFMVSTAFSIAFSLFTLIIYMRYLAVSLGGCGVYGENCVLNALIICLISYVITEIVGSFLSQNASRVSLKEIPLLMGAHLSVVILFLCAMTYFGQISTSIFEFIEILTAFASIKLICYLLPKLSDSLRRFFATKLQ